MHFETKGIAMNCIIGILIALNSVTKILKGGKMKGLRLIIVSILVLMIAVPICSADSGKNKKKFIGMWQGIDPLDGSEALRSITLDDDGIYNIVGYESFYNGCYSATGNPRGIVEATGSVEDGVLITDYFALKCQNGPVYDDISVEYIRDKKNGTIIESIGGGFPPVILHKVSK